MTIGLARGTVDLRPHDKKWEEEFRDERNLLQQMFNGKILQIEHVGSTSIPDLMAKPIIDIDAVVDSFEEIDNEFIQKLQNLGYEYMPERMFVDRKFFPKGPRSKRTHHLNFVLPKSKKLEDDLLFRDYLNKSPEHRKEYQSLKIELAKKYQADRGEYTKQKERFILNIISMAKQ